LCSDCARTLETRKRTCASSDSIVRWGVRTVGASGLRALIRSGLGALAPIASLSSLARGPRAGPPQSSAVANVPKAMRPNRCVGLIILRTRFLRSASSPGCAAAPGRAAQLEPPPPPPKQQSALPLVLTNHRILEPGPTRPTTTTFDAGSRSRSARPIPCRGSQWRRRRRRPVRLMIQVGGASPLELVGTLWPGPA
jgi:hypothetical protein